MDTQAASVSTPPSSSAAQVARELGTSVPRVIRAVQRLGFDDRAGRGRLHLSPDQVSRLRDELGQQQRVQGLPATDTAALAALARSPLGLSSLRAVGRKAGLSPTAASRALTRLQAQGLVIARDETIVAGRPRHVRMLHANRTHPLYLDLARSLAQVSPPRALPDSEVPASLRHLFWNTDPAQLSVEHGGDYIARRLLRSQDPAGMAWGARHLQAANWHAAARARGLDPADRAMAGNLAQEAHR